MHTTVETTLVEDLRRARDIIAANGLGKKLFVHSSGKACTVGALLRARGAGGQAAELREVDSPRMRVAVSELVRTLGLRVPRGDESCDPYLDLRSLIYDWNDRESTTQAEVVELFNATIARLS